MYNIDYEVCAIFISFIIVLLCMTRKNIFNIQFGLFMGMVIALMLSCVFDIYSGVASTKIDEYPVWSIYLSNYLYFIFQSAIAIMFCLYNVQITARVYKKKKLLRILFFVPYFILIISLFINLFTNFVFSVNDKEGYVRENGIWIFYAIGIFYLACSFVFVFAHRRAVSRIRLICVSLFELVMLIHIVIQYIYPKLLIQAFGEALCLLILYIGVERPEDLIDSQLGVYKRMAFVNKAKMCFEENIPFTVISITIDDREYLEKTFGIEVMNNFENALADYLKTVSKKCEIYHTSNYAFYLVTRKMDIEEIKRFTNELCVDCDRNWIIGDLEIPVDTDVCVVQCPGDVNNVNQLFECTEYFANEDHGRESRVIYANEYNSFYGKRRAKIKHAIHRAVRNNAFQVYYQPIFSTECGCINSAEALVRLFDDDLGFISPEEFIPISEEDGSILKIGDFVLETVCKFIKENEITKKGIKYIEVNVSVIECMKQDMAKRVSDKIAKYGLRPGQINLEITETATLNSPEMLGINMNQLVSGGVKFSLDDYGSGYSNINYLIELPFNLIKVDKNIVWSSFKNEKAGIALESSIDMIRRLGFSIVAEGIETQYQADKLASMGCEFLQGYFYSKPLSPEKFLEFLDYE